MNSERIKAQSKQFLIETIYDTLDKNKKCATIHTYTSYIYIYNNIVIFRKSFPHRQLRQLNTAKNQNKKNLALLLLSSYLNYRKQYVNVNDV